MGQKLNSVLEVVLHGSSCHFCGEALSLLGHTEFNIFVQFHFQFDLIDQNIKVRTSIKNI